MPKASRMLVDSGRGGKCGRIDLGGQGVGVRELGISQGFLTNDFTLEWLSCLCCRGCFKGLVGSTFGPFKFLPPQHLSPNIMYICHLILNIFSTNHEDVPVAKSIVIDFP